MDDILKLSKIVNYYKIVPKKRLGQNFILDKNALEKIIENILPIEGFNLIEIGPGPGGLTLAALNKKPKKMILIEKDASFEKILKDILEKNKKIQTSLLIEDFLKLNLKKLINGKTKILSNLPYYISTQILLKLLPLDKRIEKVMFTFQKEVADRIIAKPNSKNYSRLSVISQAVCSIEKKQTFSEKIFYPTPKVKSSVLVFTKRGKSMVEDFETLKQLTKLAFNKRRKKIKNSLKDLENIYYYLHKLKIDENIRPEQVSVELYCDLANLVYKTNK